MRNEHMGRSFSDKAKAWALKVMGFPHNIHRRTICNVLKELHEKTGEDDLCAEAVWMAKRMNDKLCEYKWKEEQRKNG